MVESKYSISLINHIYESYEKNENVKILPILGIEEENNEWFFKDVLGNRAKTSKKLIYDFVFSGKRIKVFGEVYFYPVYYPQYKPNSRELESLKKKLI